MDFNKDIKTLENMLKQEHERFCEAEAEYRKNVRTLRGQIQKLENTKAKARAILELDKALTQGKRWKWKKDKHSYHLLPYYVSWNAAGRADGINVQATFQKYDQKNDSDLIMRFEVSSWAYPRLRSRKIALPNIKASSPETIVQKAADLLIERELKKLLAGK